MLRHNPIKEGISNARFRGDVFLRLDAMEQAIGRLEERINSADAQRDVTLGDLLTQVSKSQVSIEEISAGVKELRESLRPPKPKQPTS